MNLYHLKDKDVVFDYCLFLAIHLHEPYKEVVFSYRQGRTHKGAGVDFMTPRFSS